MEFHVLKKIEISAFIAHLGVPGGVLAVKCILQP